MTGIGYKWGNTEHFCTSKMIEDYADMVLYTITRYAHINFVQNVSEKIVFKNYRLWKLMIPEKVPLKQEFMIK